VGDGTDEVSAAVDVERQGVALQERGQRQRGFVGARRRYSGSGDERRDR